MKWSVKKLTKVLKMEKIRMIISYMSEWSHQRGLPYISQSTMILVSVALFLIVLIILFLVLRKLKLWYWRVNVQINMLQSIDTKLKHMEEKMTTEVRMNPKIQDSESQCPNMMTGVAEAVAQEGKIAEGKGQTAVGRSGKVYTETDLERLIKD